MKEFILFCFYAITPMFLMLEYATFKNPQKLLNAIAPKPAGFEPSGLHILFGCTNILYFIWNCVGLLTFQWWVFLIILILGLIKKQYVLWVRIDALITIGLLIFALVNYAKFQYTPF